MPEERLPLLTTGRDDLREHQLQAPRVVPGHSCSWRRARRGSAAFKSTGRLAPAPTVPPGTCATGFARPCGARNSSSSRAWSRWMRRTSAARRRTATAAGSVAALHAAALAVLRHELAAAAADLRYLQGFLLSVAEEGEDAEHAWPNDAELIQLTRLADAACGAPLVGADPGAPLDRCTRPFLSPVRSSRWPRSRQAIAQSPRPCSHPQCAQKQ